MALHEKDLTLKQRNYLRIFAQTNFDKSKKRECALQAGYSPNNLSQTVSNLGNNKRMNEIVKEKMAEKGLTVDYFVDKQKELMECMHPQFKESPDNMNRRLALDMAYKITETYPNTKIDINKYERKDIVFTIEDYRLAQEVTGEKIIDVESEEMPEVEPLY